MNVQLTSYGIQVLNGTSKQLEITRYVLGTDSGYIPDQNATGIRGNSVYTNSPVGPAVINANTYQYTVLLDYPVGPFTFGEIALYDENQCVAVAVSEVPIQKMSATNAGSGNSIRLDIYLSMVSGNYNTWGEYIGSDISSQIPVVGNLDNLPPVQKSDPNFYIIAPFSSTMSAVLAYTAGNNGLWHFDCYSFSNIQSFTVQSASANSVTIDISGLTAQERQDLIAINYGDKVVEFSSGACYSICRTVSRVTVQSSRAIINFRTPLAILPAVGDTFMYLSRTPLSAQQIHVATPDQAGLVKPGEDFTVESDGSLSLSFEPVKTVNNVYPDENGNVQITVDPTVELAENDDLDEIVDTGTYVNNGHTVLNAPPTEDQNFVLEVTEAENIITQKVTSSLIYIRCLTNDEWSQWELVLSTNAAIQGGTF